VSRTAVSVEQLADAARAQTDLPGGDVTDVRPAWDDRLPDFWGVTVSLPERTSNAFFRVSDGRVAVPAGFDQAARELSELRPLDEQAWGGGLIYVVMAVGGTTPGFPDAWSARETSLPDGGMRVTVTTTEAQVAYAVAGGVGPSPSASSGRGGGVTKIPKEATATLDISEDYGLQWRYELGERVIDGPDGRPADSAPTLTDDQLVRALDGARLRARAPRAVPASEPRPLEGHPDVVVVDLWALGPVYVPLGSASTQIDWSAPPSTIVPLLSAADALPPGILPADLVDTAEVTEDELTASVPAPLAEWSASGGQRVSPRVPGVKTEEELGRPGRVRIKLDDSLAWALEVNDGGSWRPASGDVP
jgi:hypothetical protein